MKRLAIDIETSPNVADVWGLWNSNVSLSQLRESTRMLCFAAQWEDEPTAMFHSEWHDGHEGMVAAAYNLLCEADTVIHYNGRRFDVPHINRELITLGFNPPSPYKQVDLYREVKKAFKFPSYKLAYVAPALGCGDKVKHEGHELWVKVMAGDPVAQAEMRTYCTQDTELLFPLYRRLRPWISVPNVGAMTGELVCPACGSGSLRKEGHAYTLTGKFQRYQCRPCGTWTRDTHRVGATSLTRVAS